jgi:hypothetical protein
MVKKMTGTEFVKDKIVDIHELELQRSLQDGDKVSRVVLKTSEGSITYKPFRYVNEVRKVNGFKVSQSKKEAVNITELSKKLWQLNERLGTGMCRVKMSYFLWKKKLDNHVVLIRYMKEKQIEEIMFIEIEEKVI